MLYTKFQLTRASGSGEKVDFGSLAIFSNSGHLLLPTSLNFIILKPCSLVMQHVKFENHGYSGFQISNLNGLKRQGRRKFC